MILTLPTSPVPSYAYRDDAYKAQSHAAASIRIPAAACLHEEYRDPLLPESDHHKK